MKSRTITKTAVVAGVIALMLIATHWASAIAPHLEPTLHLLKPELPQGEDKLVIINEVYPAPQEGEYEWVELAASLHTVYLPLALKNTTDASDLMASSTTAAASGIVDISGWQITDEDGNIYTIPDALPPLPVNAYVLIYFDGQGEAADDYDFSDGKAELHTPPGMSDVFEDDADQVALYADGDHNPDTIRDFVAYGAPAGEDAVNAVEAGLWNEFWQVSLHIGSGVEAVASVPDGLPDGSSSGALVYGIDPGYSIGVVPGHGSDSPEDWTVYQGDDCTPGTANATPGVYWTTAFDGMTMGADGFALGWALVPGATYRFQMDDDENFSSPEVDEILSSPHYAPESPPPPGSYYWRVQVIDAQGHAGAWSTPLYVGIREVVEVHDEGAEAVQQVIVPNLTWLRQRKDTKLLCIDGDARGNPNNDPDALENAWDTVHPNAIHTHGRNNCVRASIAMGVTRYGGDLSQDRISYQMFEVWGNPTSAEVGTPTGDLGHDRTTCVGGNDGCTTMRLLEWSLNVVSTTIAYDVHSCGWTVMGATDHPTFAQIRTWIDAGRPILEAHANCHADNPATPVDETCGCGAHATIIGGYRVLADGTQQIRNFDPWSAATWVDYNDDASTAADETFYVDWAYALPAAAPSVRSDEPSIWTDSDGDRIMDFDEYYRFASSPGTPDSDEDWVDDKSDLAEVYFNAAGNYAPKAAGADMDTDSLRKEIDPDNDGGGTVDGCEDSDYDGRRDAGETNNFSAADDTTCVPAFEIRSPTTTAYAEVGDKSAPDKTMIRVLAGIPPAAGTLTLTSSDFAVEIGGDAASLVSPPYSIGDEYWLIVQPPVKGSDGYYSLKVTLQGTQTDTESNAIHYSNTPRAPMDEVLVIDNSGSMASQGRMVSAKNAARAFIDRWKDHDMVGLVAFSTTVSIPLPLTEVTATTTLTTARMAINSMPDSPDPYWYTAIGSGLLRGKAELATSTGGHPQSIVLLSDGMENISPKWSDPSSGVRTAFTGCNIKVHTVAIGASNASYRKLLQNISQNACNGDGTAWHTSGGGTSPYVPAAETAAAAASFPSDLSNRLADIYLSIAELDAGHQRLWEATGNVDREVPHVYYVYVPSGLPEAIWTVNWNIGTLDLSLQDPHGNPVQASDPAVTRVTDATHDQFRIGTPTSGMWKVTITNIGQEDLTEYLAVLSARSDAQMWLLFGLIPLDRSVGMRLPINVALADHKAIAGATVTITIKSPNQDFDRVFNLYDDGVSEDIDPDDGLYGNPAFYALEQVGTYSVKAVATGIDNDGEPFKLHLTRSFYVLPRLAYIYKADDPTDVATAYSYQRLLGDNGFHVELIPIDTIVASTNFYPYELLIIGPGTGSLGNWEGSADAVSAIDNSWKPIIGLGEGGSAFFDQVGGLDIGWLNSAYIPDDEVYVVDTLSSVWADPYPITIPGPRTVALYTDATYHLGVYSPSPPADVTLIGEEPTSSSYYPIIQQASRYVLWGFDGPPEEMTETGKQVFVNLAWYAE